MIKRMLLMAMLCLTTLSALASNAPLVEDMVGSGPLPAVQEIPLGPDAIVMKNNAGADVLVVFYRLNGDDQKAGFMIAYGADPITGQLIWDAKKYVLKTTALKSGGFSPAPVLLNDRLYLFGRDRTYGDGRHIIYNYFDSLDDLIAHTEGGAGGRHFQDHMTKGHGEFDHLSVTTVDDAILVSYYQKDGKETSPVPFSLSRCESMDNALLSCTTRVMTHKGSYGDPTAVAHATVNGVDETLLLVRDGSKNMTVHVFDPVNTDWNFLYRATQVPLPGTPLTSVEADGELFVYFKEIETGTKGSGRLFKTKARSDAIFANSSSWSSPAAVGDKLFETHTAAKAIVFQNRVYVFYVRVFDKQRVCVSVPCARYTGMTSGCMRCNDVSPKDALWYFSDMTVN